MGSEMCIRDRPVAFESRCKQKLSLREVMAVEPATLKFLRWSESPITFDRANHPSSVPRPRRCPLVVDPIVGNTRLSKVLMDGGSGLNILYADNIDAMGIDRSRLRPSGGLLSTSSFLEAGDATRAD